MVSFAIKELRAVGGTEWRLPRQPSFKSGTEPKTTLSLWL